jgi:hypothetical protein
MQSDFQILNISRLNRSFAWNLCVEFVSFGGSAFVVIACYWWG